MPAMTRYVHTNVVARDWRKLAGFYTRVFGCKPVIELQRWDRGTGGKKAAGRKR